MRSGVDWSNRGLSGSFTGSGAGARPGVEDAGLAADGDIDGEQTTWPQLAPAVPSDAHRSSGTLRVVGPAAVVASSARLNIGARPVGTRPE